MQIKIQNIVVVLFLLSTTAWAEEQTLDLGNEPESSQAVAAPRSHESASSFNLMGRIDLTTEITPYEAPKSVENNRLKNNHFLVFLKARPSPKVSFMGELVSQSFFEATYQFDPKYSFRFGKIVVPFGDTRRFHHFYGGVQGYGPQGVMFPNIWAESGIDFESRLDSVNLDLYWVSGISSTAENVNPDFRVASNNRRQAAGFRATTESLVSRMTFIASVYYDEWWPAHPLYLYGLDAVSEYKFLPWGFLERFRFSLGRAQADVRKGLQGDYQKSGDYIEIATNYLNPGEFRLRYGTYIDDSRNKTSSDVHNFNVGYSLPIDVMRLLAEYQMNYEAVDEVQNDLVRLMLSLDF